MTKESQQLRHYSRSDRGFQNMVHRINHLRGLKPTVKSLSGDVAFEPFAPLHLCLCTSRVPPFQSLHRSYSVPQHRIVATRIGTTFEGAVG